MIAFNQNIRQTIPAGLVFVFKPCLFNRTVCLKFDYFIANGLNGF
jgi:hypothetical protein